MSHVYLDLAERIRGELTELERVVNKALISWEQAMSISGESAFLDSVALNLHSFYSGTERLFELISKNIDAELPNGPTWHKDLLWLMTKDKPNVRPAVISRDVAGALDEFRRFRHLVRNVYTMSLVPEKMAGLTSALEREYGQFCELNFLLLLIL